MTDTNALNKRIRLIQASGWIRFVVSAVCLYFVFSRSISWLTWVLSFAAFIFLLLSLSDAGMKTSTEKLFDLVNEGEFSIVILAEKLKRKEDYVRKGIREFIRIGVFPGATIANDVILLAGAGQETHNPENNIPSVSESISVQKIDINTASEQELATLPGVGIAIAKRTAEMRKQIGGFSSVQDFCGRLELMPHFAVQIENLALVTPIKFQTSPSDSKDRVVDI